MTLEIINEEPLQPLTTDEEAIVCNKLKELWTLGENALSKPRKRKERIVKAYECQHDQIILKRNGSKAYIPWIYTAHESAHARLSNSLLPNDEDIFALVGETEDDQPGADMMQEYLKIVLKEMGWSSILDDGIKELLFSEVVIKVYWLKKQKPYTDLDPVTGQPVMAMDTVYNNVYAEIINSEDFIIYPVCGDIARASCAHRVWRHKDELMAVQEQGVYRNVDLISDREEEHNEAEDGKSDHQGLEVKEFWIHRIKVGDRVYRNMIATMVEGKHLIRFEPNPYDYGLVPFIYCPLVKNYSAKGGLQNTGHALTDRAFEIQKMANFLVNQMFDESKLKLYGMYKYTDDSAFNPGNFISRPGGLIKVGDINNLQPLNPNINQISFGIQELQYLENQFETATGVPKFLKGIMDDQPGKDTATAKRLAAEGADTRFRAIARRVDENILKPFIEMLYVLTRQYAMQDPAVMLDIARRTQQTRVKQQVPVMDPMTGQPQLDPMTGQPVMEEQTVELTDDQILKQCPVIPPLGKIDVNVVGFENVLNKADKAGQFERFVAGVSGMAQYAPELLKRIKEDDALDYYARNLSIDGDLLRNDEEMLQLQQQEMARQAQIIEMAARQNVDPNQLGGMNAA